MARVRRCQPLLGTFVSIRAEDPHLDASALHARVDEAFRAIQRVQRLMSFHDPASELSRLNAMGHREPVRVHPWTRRVLEESVRLGDASGGALDVGVASALVRRGLLPEHVGAGCAGDGGSYRDLRLHDDGRVGFARPLRVDLGGIAKGFAVDRACHVLEAAGIGRGLVDAGGDLRFVGPLPSHVRLRAPHTPWRDRVTARLVCPAVATSGGYFAAREASDAPPLLDPRTHRPFRRCASITVFAPTALQADALTKAVALTPPALWRPLLAAEGAHAVRLGGWASGRSLRRPGGQDSRRRALGG